MGPRIVPAEPHGPLHEVLPGLHLVRGRMGFGPARFSRNMTVVKHQQSLVLVNSVRLDEAGLHALNTLGRVTDVIRLAGGHGRDDPFYKQHYGATVWAVRGQRYFVGTDPKRGRTYFEPDRWLDEGAVPPLPGAELLTLGGSPPEAVLVLPVHGGTVIAGDSLQNWATTTGHFNLAGGIMFRVMGFIGPHRLGKGWVDGCSPDPRRLHALLDRRFDNVLPAHGDPVLGRAHLKYRPAIAALSAQG